MLSIHRNKFQSDFDFCSEHFNRHSDDGSLIQKVLKVAKNGNILYCAVESVLNGCNYVTCLIVKTSWDNSNYYNFAYKTICETSHPHYYYCPNSILKMLTPVDELPNEWFKFGDVLQSKQNMRTWRNHCINSNIELREKAKHSLRKGNIIKLSTPVHSGNGSPVSVVEVYSVKPLRFKVPGKPEIFEIRKNTWKKMTYSKE